jgi:hypothetical protein
MIFIICALTLNVYVALLQSESNLNRHFCKPPLLKGIVGWGSAVVPVDSPSMSSHYLGYLPLTVFMHLASIFRYFDH